MHKIDITIARLRLLLAEIGGRMEALANTRHQYQEQIAHLVNLTVHGEAGVDRALSMLLDIDTRMEQLGRQEHYLETIRARARRELDSLQLTKLVEETRARLTTLRQRQAQLQERPPAPQALPEDRTEGARARYEGSGAQNIQDDLIGLEREIRRLEALIADASGAAAKSLSAG